MISDRHGLLPQRVLDTCARAQHNVQRTGAPFNQRLEEFVTSAEARALAEELCRRERHLEVTARHRATRA